MMKSRISGSHAMTLAIALALAFGLTLTVEAEAGQPSGTAQVEAVDPVARTVVLQGETYLLLPSTDFVDSKGHRADLTKLRAVPKGVSLVSERDFDVVRWRAIESRNGWVLEELRILEHMPD